MPEFRIVTGHGESFTYDVLQDVITIGRSKDNDVPLDDQTASRNHVNQMAMVAEPFGKISFSRGSESYHQWG